MHFHALVDEIQDLSLAEKQEVRTLLDRFVAEERRREMVGNHAESLEELHQGRLEFTNDSSRLRRMLDD